jgi:HAE1 family hydrophobic/amphiphilic exporter-1
MLSSSSTQSEGFSNSQEESAKQPLAVSSGNSLPVSSQKTSMSTLLPNKVDYMTAEPQTLSLQQVVELALKNNKDVEIAQQSVRLAEYDLQEARASNIPRFSSFTGVERTVEPAFSFISGGVDGKTTQSAFTVSAAMEGKLRKYGSDYKIEYSNSRSTTNNQFVALSPNNSSSVTFSFTQPLMRGFKIDNDRRVIKIGEKRLQLADVQFRQNVIDLATAAETAYWDLNYALRNWQIQNEMVRDARAQLDHTQRLVAKGLSAPVDVASAEMQLANFERSMYSSYEAVSRAENTLKNLITENGN